MTITHRPALGHRSSIEQIAGFRAASLDGSLASRNTAQLCDAVSTLLAMLSAVMGCSDGLKAQTSRDLRSDQTT